MKAFDKVTYYRPIYKSVHSVAISIRQKPRNHLKNQTSRLVFEMISRFLTNPNSHKRPNFTKCSVLVTCGRGSVPSDGNAVDVQ